ncbi:hypothetical protein [uncultured Rothia sp.]|uniref:hypothetical protein n=1 Tax=uncultured Rothia sp. TaxID=316088 RepID=UPI0028ED4777|nr:hypothetical protein [uncultured Rothia sp.]
MTAKTKRDRSAGRAHRHTAIQGIINNHQGIIDDIASIDNSIACLQDETCDLGSRLDHWYTILDEKNSHTRKNVAYTMRCVVENERKQAEVEAAVGILQHTSKEHQADIATLNHTSKDHREAIAQLIAYTNKVHGRQTALNQEINLLQAEVDGTQAELKTLSKLTILLGAAMLLACITLFFITTTH